MLFPEGRRLLQLPRAGPSLHRTIWARPRPGRPGLCSDEPVAGPQQHRAARGRRRGPSVASRGRHRSVAEGQQEEEQGKLRRQSHPPALLPAHRRRPSGAWAGASGACRCSGRRRRFGAPAKSRATRDSEGQNSCWTDVVARAKRKGGWTCPRNLRSSAATRLGLLASCHPQGASATDIAGSRHQPAGTFPGRTGQGGAAPCWCDVRSMRESEHAPPCNHARRLVRCLVPAILPPPPARRAAMDSLAQRPGPDVPGAGFGRRAAEASLRLPVERS